MPLEKLTCFELLDCADPLLSDVKKLYERTQAPQERIPWEWLEHSVERRQQWRPGRWCPHLLVAATDNGTEVGGPASGFLYGGHIPDFGGYICYTGVDPAARKQGVGTRLFEQFFKLAAVDAFAEGVALPFVVWESHRPEPDASPADWDIWQARVRLFARVGAGWVEGIDFQSPNWANEEESLPLQLFVKPIDLRLEAFDSAKLKEIAAGLHEKVYKHNPDDPLVRATLPPGAQPRLRSPLEAGKPVERRQAVAV
jgi:GNAT superfamily N-acetyltransferase